jgi:hypothetical protein
MKTKEVYKLKKGDRINHKHYGICTVDSIIPDFGPRITPESKEGMDLLRFHSGMPNGTPLLESSFSLIIGKVS